MFKTKTLSEKKEENLLKKNLFLRECNKVNTTIRLIMSTDFRAGVPISTTAHVVVASREATRLRARGGGSNSGGGGSSSSCSTGNSGSPGHMAGPHLYESTVIGEPNPQAGSLHCSHPTTASPRGVSRLSLAGGGHGGVDDDVDVV